MLAPAEPEPFDRITVHVIPAESGDPPSRPAAATRANEWIIKTSGRAFVADDSGFAKLEAVLTAFADLNRRPTPPRLAERVVVIRADPAAPDAITRRVLEISARAGFYRFEIGDPARRPETR